MCRLEAQSADGMVLVTTFAEWREIGENLGRVASVREKADSPMDRIVVQAKDGLLKVIAGNYNTTMIVTVGMTDQKGIATVPARTFLTAIKTLKAKGEAELVLTNVGASIVTGFGSSIDMNNLPGENRMLKPYLFKKGDGVTIPFPEGFLPTASKYITPCTGEHAPYNQVLGQMHGKEMFLKASDDHMGVEIGGLFPSYPLTLHFNSELFPAIKGLEWAGGFWVPEHVPPQVHQVQVMSGKFRVVSVIYPQYPKFPWVADSKYTVKVEGDKKAMADLFKSMAGRHPYARVIMTSDGEKFSIKSGDTGEAQVQATVTGKGTLPVNATFMAKVLATVEGKTATIEYTSPPSLVRVIGDKNVWPVRVAPMK